ncbi:MAG: transglutaminase-like domain-containing protein, partial [Planctomycetota bacterium]
STDLHGGVNVETFAGRVVPREEASAVLAASLRVPEHLRDQLAVLAEQLMGDLSTTPEKVRAVEAYFHENYRYKLGIQVPPDQDPIAWFLRARPPAHCEFFAAAATLVLRAGGVPSRYVTGFVARERNEAGGYWVARNRDAHAWTEAYDRASRTWVTVEATPADGVPQPQQTPWLAGLLDRFEQGLLSLRTAHFRGGFIGVVAWLGRAGWRLLVALVTRWWGWPILAVAAWWLGRKLWRRIRPWLARPRRSPPDPVVQAMRKLLARVDRKLARRGLARADGETLHQFARRIRPIDPAASDWYLAYARRRYSGQLRADDLQTLRGDQTGW